MKLKGIKVAGLVEKDGKLSPARKRYDASTEAKRAGQKDKVAPTTRRRANSVPRIERSDLK